MKLFRAKALMSLFITLPTLSLASELSLNDFLKQVETKNQSMSAARLSVEAAEAKAQEGKLIFRPNIFAQAQSSIDKKPTTNKLAQGDRTDYTFFTAGLTEQFAYGLQGKIGYNYSHTKIFNASTSFLPISDFRDGVATLELSQSLWRNFWGREAKSQESIITSQSLASKHTENYKMKVTFAQAESAYWSLSQVRKIVKVQKESLERAQKIREWNQNRLKNGLAESSDFLQSDANYKAREYELKSTLQDLKNLERTVNSYRGIDSEVFNEDLESVNSSKLKSLTLPAKADLRDDTKAALELQKIAKANAALAIEKNKPTFEIYGSYAMNGRNVIGSEAISQSLSTNHDTKAIGLRFVAPLDFHTTSNNITGYQKDQVAAEENFQRKLFDQDQQWNDLVSRFEDARMKLSLVEKIEEAQKIKASNERDRLSKGRTVTFQVLNFEQDYAQSELTRIQNETNILNIYSQLKIFSAGGNK
jgi:outer membrane protein TolC